MIHFYWPELKPLTKKINSSKEHIPNNELADQHDLDHHVKVSSGAKFLILSRMLNQPESLSDKIPLSSSLKGKELALNWGRQNINHTQRVLLSIHHQIPIEKLKCYTNSTFFLLCFYVCQFRKSKGYFYMHGALKKSWYLFFSTHYLRSTNFDRSLYQGIYRPIFRRWPSRGRLTTRVKWISLFFCYY